MVSLGPQLDRRMHSSPRIRATAARTGSVLRPFAQFEDVFAPQSIDDRAAVAQAMLGEDGQVDPVYELSCRSSESRRIAVEEPRRSSWNRIEAPEPVDLLVAENRAAAIGAEAYSIPFTDASPDTVVSSEAALLVHMGARVARAAPISRTWRRHPPRHHPRHALGEVVDQHSTVKSRTELLTVVRLPTTRRPNLAQMV